MRITGVLLLLLCVYWVPICQAAFNPVEGDVEKLEEEQEIVKSYEARLGLVDDVPLLVPGEDALTLGQKAFSQVDIDRVELIVARKEKEKRREEKKMQMRQQLNTQNARLDALAAERGEKKELTKKRIPVIIQVVIVAAGIWCACSFRRKKD